MNRTHQLIWNEHTGRFCAVAETARARGKPHGGTRPLAIAAAVLVVCAAVTRPAHAAPQGGQISAGAGSISQAGNATRITQTSQRMAIDWSSFSTAPHESVTFAQPDANSIALNRVTGTSASHLLGSMSANGQVFVLNPNGVLFGRDAQVSVGGLLASTLGLGNADFMAGRTSLSQAGAGNVVNLGQLNATSGGYVALLGSSVLNDGSIRAAGGQVLLAAGDRITLQLESGSLLGWRIDQGTARALVDNRMLISADGGRVILTAKGVDALSTAVVNNTGVIQARTVQNRSGVIVLLGDMQHGEVNVGGVLDASAPGAGNGGFIETSAAKVKVADNTRITTHAVQGVNGTWLIDPTDFNVSASGGDMTGATLTANLQAGNVTIQSTAGVSGTAGDVNITDAVTWSANTLTLSAQRNVNIGASLNGSGTAKLALEYGQSSPGGAGATYTVDMRVGAKVYLPAGQNFSTRQGSTGPVVTHTVITALGAPGSATTTDLQGMQGNLAGHYVLGADIDASSTSTWNGGAGFLPVGPGAANQFVGSFDGLGHTITSLSINRPSSVTPVGLFGTAQLASFSNVSLQGHNIVGNSNVGSLIGRVNSGGAVIFNVNASGNVSGVDAIGGLIGNGDTGVSARNVSTSGTVTGQDLVGGLIGVINHDTISNAYSTATVTGRDRVGGLLGYMFNSTVSDVYATGDVSGTLQTGGLIGAAAKDFVAMPLVRAYASGKVTGATAGGLIGQSDFTPVDAYWNRDTTQQVTSAGSTASNGKTAAQMQQAASFVGFSIDAQGGTASTWRIYEGSTQPLLRSFLRPATLADSTVTYNGAPQTGGVTALAAGGTAASGINAGTYANSYYSSQTGYDFSGGSLTITPRVVTLSGSRVYDGTNVIGAAVLSFGPLVGSQTLGLTGQGTMASKDAGSGKTVSLGSLALADGSNGGLAANYTLSGASITADITPRPLMLTAVGLDKPFDQSAEARVMLTDNRIATDSLVVNYRASFGDSAVGSGKTVRVSGITYSGPDAGNYSYPSSLLTSASITPVSQETAAVGQGPLATAYSSGRKSAAPEPLREVPGGPSNAPRNPGTSPTGALIVNCGVRMTGDASQVVAINRCQASYPTASTGR